MDPPVASAEVKRLYLSERYLRNLDEWLSKPRNQQHKNYPELATVRKAVSGEAVMPLEILESVEKLLKNWFDTKEVIDIIDLTCDVDKNDMREVQNRSSPCLLRAFKEPKAIENIEVPELDLDANVSATEELKSPEGSLLAEEPGPIVNASVIPVIHPIQPKSYEEKSIKLDALREVLKKEQQANIPVREVEAKAEDSGVDCCESDATDEAKAGPLRKRVHPKKTIPIDSPIKKRSRSRTRSSSQSMESIQDASLQAISNQIVISEQELDESIVDLNPNPSQLSDNREVEVSTEVSAILSRASSSEMIAEQSQSIADEDNRKCEINCNSNPDSQPKSSQRLVENDEKAETIAPKAVSSGRGRGRPPRRGCGSPSLTNIVSQIMYPVDYIQACEFPKDSELIQSNLDPADDDLLVEVPSKAKKVKVPRVATRRSKRILDINKQSEVVIKTEPLDDDLADPQ